MKKRQKLLSDEQWELMEPLLPQRKRRRDGRGQAISLESKLFRGYFVDSANRCGLAIAARGVSLACHLLAALAEMGDGRGLATSLAHPPGGLGSRRIAEMG